MTKCGKVINYIESLRKKNIFTFSPHHLPDLIYLVRHFPFQAQQKFLQCLDLSESWLYDEGTDQENKLGELSVSHKSLFITTNTSVFVPHLVFSTSCLKHARLICLRD